MSEASVSPDDIQKQLEEKDRLIQALTDRLSEAAEQLDRNQRSGGSKSSRSSGPSAEMLEQQRALMEKLSVALGLWEDVQPRDAFARVERRLDDLRELLEAGAGSEFTPRTTADALLERNTEQREEPTETSQDEEGESQPSAWEALKAQLLESGAVESQKFESGAVEAQKSGSSNLRPASDSPALDHVPVAEPIVADVELPTPINLQTAAREELEQAIEVRDGYIRYLTGRLHREEQRTREAIDWDALNNAPAELRAALQALERDLEDRLRIAEVDLSLERARLSRVQSRTEELQRQIERRLKSKKKINPSDAAQKDRSGENNSSKGWFRTLGLK